MKYHITINECKLVDEFPEYWSAMDYRALLEVLEFGDASSLKDAELREMTLLALTDLEPDEAARVILEYKLSRDLNEGQRDQISHEMLLDKISEEYADIKRHHELFHINQLLYKAFNGTFPNAKASIIELEIKPSKANAPLMDRSTLLKTLYTGLSERSILKRLFEDQLQGEATFAEAEDILWDFKVLGDDVYRITTSEYWLDQNDFTAAEFDGEVVFED